MGRKFKIERDYYDEKDYLYRKMHVEFEPGLTVLIVTVGLRSPLRIAA